MLLDPFEEEFDLPPRSINLSDRKRRQKEVISQEDEAFADVLGVIADATKRSGITLRGDGACQYDRLIASQTDGFIDGSRAATLKLQIASGANDEVGERLVQIDTGGQNPCSHDP